MYVGSYNTYIHESNPELSHEEKKNHPDSKDAGAESLSLPGLS